MSAPVLRVPPLSLMDRRTERRRACRQGAAVLAAAAIGVGAVAMVSHSGAGPDELKIPIAEARSQAAELYWLASAPAGVLPPRFVRTQQAQLRKNMERTRKALDDLRPVDALQALPAQAKPHLEALGGETDAAALRAHRQALAALEQGLKR